MIRSAPLRPLIARTLASIALLAWVQASADTAPSERAELWVQTSAEYAALARGAYRSATAHLRPALEDPHWTAALEQGPGAAGLPPAIILDVDETILDNGPFQGSIIKAVAEGVRDDYYPRAWDQWVSMAQAQPVPGAPEFVWAARALGAEVFYVTNRACGARPGTDSACPQEADTLANLARAGLPPTDAAHLLLKGEQPDWGSEKTNRRALIAQSHRVVMLAGDDLGDFLPGAKGMPLDLRRARAQAAGDWWGTRWIILPNPIYGSWKQGIDPQPLDHLVAVDALVDTIKEEYAQERASKRESAGRSHADD